MALRRYEHVAGSARTEVREDAVELYKAGSTIREIARTLGRSYGFVHRLLLEEPSITLRSRGARSIASKISDSPAVVEELPGQLELGDFIHAEHEQSS
jgi:hypothetical protein